MDQLPNAASLRALNLTLLDRESFLLYLRRCRARIHTSRSLTKPPSHYLRLKCMAFRCTYVAWNPNVTKNSRKTGHAEERYLLCSRGPCQWRIAWHDKKCAASWRCCPRQHPILNHCSSAPICKQDICGTPGTRRLLYNANLILFTLLFGFCVKFMHHLWSRSRFTSLETSKGALWNGNPFRKVQ